MSTRGSPAGRATARSRTQASSGSVASGTAADAGLRSASSGVEIERWLRVNAPGPRYALGQLSTAALPYARAFAAEMADLARAFPAVARTIDIVALADTSVGKDLTARGGSYSLRENDHMVDALTPPAPSNRAHSVMLFNPRLFTAAGDAQALREGAPGLLRRGSAAIRRGTRPSMGAYTLRHEFFHALARAAQMETTNGLPHGSREAYRAAEAAVTAAAKRRFAGQGGFVSRYARDNATTHFSGVKGTEEIMAEIFAGRTYGGARAARQYQRYLAPLITTLGGGPSAQ